MTNKPQNWIESADMTYCSSRLLFLRYNIFLWFDAAFLLHQSLEKYAKALLFSKGKKRRGHNLSKLFGEIIRFFPELNTHYIKSLIDKLNKILTIRYPDTPFSGEGIGQEELMDADFLVRLIRERIPFTVTSEGIRKVVSYQLENYHKDLIQIILKDNDQRDYWEKELKGINKDIDSFIEKISGSKTSDNKG